MAVKQQSERMTTLSEKQARVLTALQELTAEQGWAGALAVGRRGNRECSRYESWARDGLERLVAKGFAEKRMVRIRGYIWQARYSAK